MARAFLVRKGVEEARLEADLLVAHALGLNRLGMLLQLERPLEPQEVDRARDALVRRGRREPVAYITGRREFYGRSFAVGPGVLIPRPETEGIVDRALSLVRSGALPENLRILDWGTGSGCLAITLALECPGAQVTGLDVSPEALGFARRNGERLGATVEWVQADGARRPWPREPVDLLVANPPYVDRATQQQLAPEVREFEPHGALFGPDGAADHYVRTLIDLGPDAIRPGGHLILELGHDQGQAARAYARERGWQAELLRDLAGIERCLSAQRPGA